MVGKVPLTKFPLLLKDHVLSTKSNIVSKLLKEHMGRKCLHAKTMKGEYGPTDIPSWEMLPARSGRKEWSRKATGNTKATKGE